MESLPAKLLNTIADVLDMPSLVIFRMINTSIRNLVSIKGPRRPKQWRGHFFVLQCGLEEYYELIEYAGQCGLRINHYNTNSGPILYSKEISATEQSLDINNLSNIEKEIVKNISTPYFATSIFRNYDVSNNMLKPLVNIMLKYKERTQLFNELMIISMINISRMKLLDEILTPDWKMVSLPVMPSQVDVMQFIASKGRQDLLKKLDIDNIITMNLTESQWKWLIDNDLLIYNKLYMKYIGNVFDTWELKLQFPITDNIGDNVRHLMRLNIPIPHFIINKLIHTGETDVLDEVLSNKLNNIDNTNIKFWLSQINKTKENFPVGLPFDNTIYQETVDILNKHIATY